MEPTIGDCVTALMAKISQNTYGEPTEKASEEEKTAFISLYYLFKEKFLLALDLLDQRRIIIGTWAQKDSWKGSIYYILSEGEQKNVIYQVRMMAWHCSCPEFAFTAFHGIYEGKERDHREYKKREDKYWGGWIRGEPVPICRHLLACVLVEHGGVWARRRVIEKQMNEEEFVLYAIE